MRQMLVVLLILAAGCPARAQTLLETVLYVVSTHEAKDNQYVKTTVVQDSRTLRSELMLKTGQKPAPVFSVRVTHVAGCRFEIDHGLGAFSARYSVDFAGTDFDNVRFATAKNRFGHAVPAVSIPGTAFCLHDGSPYLNAIAKGACSTTYYVEAGAAPSPERVGAMLSAVERLRAYCGRKTT